MKRALLPFLSILNASGRPAVISLFPSLDFASSPLSWIIYKLTCSAAWRWAGAAILVVSTLALVIKNRINIIRNERLMIERETDTIQTTE